MGKDIITERFNRYYNSMVEEDMEKETADKRSAVVPSSKDFKQLYYDLIYCVCNKIPGETRHETAKRILTQHENQTHGPCKSL